MNQGEESSSKLNSEGFFIALQIMAIKKYGAEGKVSFESPLARLVQEYIVPFYKMKMTDKTFTEAASKIKDDINELQEQFLNAEVVST
jgi:hypothetical protein